MMSINNNKKKSNASITVVVMGDEGVGKTSLISTFVSRHFSQVGIPGCMTRLTLPLDTTTYMPYFEAQAETMTTRGFLCSIVDTQGADVSLQAALLTNTTTVTSPLGYPHPTSSSQAAQVDTTTTTPPRDTTTATTTNDNNNNGSPNSSLSSPMDDQPPTMKTPTTKTPMPVMSMDINVIVLVYDLVRLDTFYRLEHHWLPLIQACFGEEVPVIIAGSKFDLWLDNNTAAAAAAASSTQEQQHQHHPTDRQRIVSLLQRFKFVRQCIKCSAKTLFHVTDIFKKAQHAVLFPIQPLYNLSCDKLTLDAERAFCRIFRMADLDFDGYLSQTELIAFQNKCYRVWGPLLDETISGWKKILSKKISNKARSRSSISKYYHYNDNDNDDEYDDAIAIVHDDKLTIAGFFSIFEVFMSKDRMEIPWQILRIYGYDDNLQLHVPSWVTVSSSTSTFLSPFEITFLISLFQQFDVNKDGVLTERDILAIFSIIPSNINNNKDGPTLPPWHPSRSKLVYKDSFSLPLLVCNPPSNNNSSSGSGIILSLPPEYGESSSLTADGITITSSRNNNTNILLTPGEEEDDVEHSSSSMKTGIILHPSFSLLDWMSYWHMSACICPIRTRVELYQLGLVGENSTNTSGRDKKSKRTISRQQPKHRQKVVPISSITSKDYHIVRVRVFGKDNCGKTAFLNNLCQTDYAAHPINNDGTFLDQQEAVSKTTPMSSCAYEILKSSSDHKNVVVHFIFTDIPEAIVNEEQPDVLINSDNNDLVMLVFNCSDASSFLYLLDLEKRLLSSCNLEQPRVFIGMHGVVVEEEATTNNSNNNNNNHEDTSSPETLILERKNKAHVLTMARLHCSNLDIEPPLVITTTTVAKCMTTLLPDKSFVLKRFIQYTASTTTTMLSSSMLKLKSIPYYNQKKKKQDEDWKKQQERIIWIGACGFFAVSAAVVFIWKTTTFWSSSTSTSSTSMKHHTTNNHWWRKSLGFLFYPKTLK